MLTLHIGATEEFEPLAVVAVGTTPQGEEPKLAENPLRGTWLRVFPRDGHDVAFIRDLEHRVDKFAPAKGEGILIRRNLLDSKRRRA